MAGFTIAHAQTTLDGAIVNGDTIQWSANGTSETASLARTAITTFAASTAADPSVRANSGAYESATASGAVTVTHFSFANSSGATQKTDWTALTASRTLAIGDKLTIASGAFYVTLT